MTNTGSQILFETFAEVDSILANVGCVPTFRGKWLGSIVDPTYLSTLWARGTVCEHYTPTHNGGGDIRMNNKSGKTNGHWSFRGEDIPGDFRRRSRSEKKGAR